MPLISSSANILDQQAGHLRHHSNHHLYSSNNTLSLINSINSFDNNDNNSRSPSPPHYTSSVSPLLISNKPNQFSSLSSSPSSTVSLSSLINSPSNTKPAKSAKNKTLSMPPPPLPPPLPPSSSSTTVTSSNNGSSGSKQLSKLKRFLTTLQQFASDISPEIGDHVRNLVLNLVNSIITIEDFHAELQKATNFPLRPFVIPFLRTNLPLLQRELLHFAAVSTTNNANGTNSNAKQEYMSANTHSNAENMLNFPNELVNSPNHLNHHHLPNTHHHKLNNNLGIPNHHNHNPTNMNMYHQNSNHHNFNSINVETNHEPTNNGMNSNGSSNSLKRKSPQEGKNSLGRNNSRNSSPSINNSFQQVQSKSPHGPPMSSLQQIIPSSTNHMQPFAFSMPHPPPPPPAPSTTQAQSLLHATQPSSLAPPISSINSTPPTNSSLIKLSKQTGPTANNNKNVANQIVANSQHHHYFNNTNNNNNSSQQQQQQQHSLSTNFANPTNPNSSHPSMNHQFQHHQQAMSQSLERISPLLLTPTQANSSANNTNNNLLLSNSSTSQNNQTNINKKNPQIKLEDMSFLRETREKEKNFTNYMRDIEHEYDSETTEESENMEDDFKNLDNMLSSITEMTSKTKRTLNALQSQTNKLKRKLEHCRVELKRRRATGDGDSDFLSQPFRSNIADRDERIEEIKKRADEMVSEVKRQAIVEMQKTLSAAEHKTNEMIMKEREKFDDILKETHKKYRLALANENADHTQQDNIQTNCWNCGRKGLETCSGCNKAKYCSQFCQHKHWDSTHHKECALTVGLKKSTSTSKLNEKAQPMHHNHYQPQNSQIQQSNEIELINIVANGSKDETQNDTIASNQAVNEMTNKSDVVEMNENNEEKKFADENIKETSGKPSPKEAKISNDSLNELKSNPSPASSTSSLSCSLNKND